MSKNELNAERLLDGESDLDACMEYQWRMDNKMSHPKDNSAYRKMNCRKMLCGHYYARQQDLKNEMKQYANNPNYNTFFFKKEMGRNTKAFKRLGCGKIFTWKDAIKLR